MDFLTHILIGYLLGAGVFTAGPLVAWTAFAAYAPDFDVFLWPLSKRWKVLRHRGVTHSLPFGAALVTVGSLVLWSVFGVPLHLALAAGAIGWASHVVLDILNWGCLLLYPWRKDLIEFTVQDRLTRPSLLSAASLALLWGLHQYAPPAWALVAQVALSVAWFGYFAWRVANKVYLRRHHGPEAHVLPTHRAFTWRVAVTRASDAMEAALLEHRVLRRGPVRVIHHSRFDPEHPEGPPATPAQAAAFTHREVAEVQALRAQRRPLHYRAERHGDGWIVRWYALDSVYGPACFGAEVTLDGFGAVEEVRQGVMPLPPAEAPLEAPVSFRLTRAA